MPLILDGTLGISGVDGTAGTPAAQGTDTNTGIFYGSDIVGISTGGTERMRINSSGNVGIGVTSVATNASRRVLQITNGTNGGAILLGNDTTTSTNNARIVSQDSGTELSLAGGGASGIVDIYTNDTERMRIDSSGNVLVGATALATGFSGFAQIEASGSSGGIVINSTAGNICRLVFTKGNASGNEGLIRYDTSEYSMQFWTNASEAMKILSSGNVGIGTSSPSGRLHAEWSVNSAVGGMYLRNTNTGSTAYGGMYFGNDTNATDAFVGTLSSANTAYGGARSFLLGSNSATPVVFMTSGVESMRLNTSGNLILLGGTTTANGVGVTFPATQSASTNANCLDDYEEGTWTPAIASGGWTSNVESATYTKIGRQVTLYFYVSLTGSGNGNQLTFSGVPFAPRTNNFATNNLDAGRISKVGTYSRIDAGTTTLQFLYPSGSTTVDRGALIGTEVGASYLVGTITYFV